MSDAESDPIPRERHEIVVSDVAQQPAHHEEGADECDHETDGDHR